MINRGIIVLCFFVFSAAVFGQSYSFKNYTTHDGLVQTDITAITQDKRGNIWIGTNGGISIFDGKKFTNYDNHDLLQSLRINALLCDSAGTMWIATHNGLLKYQNSFEVFFKPGTSRNNMVGSLTINSKNLLLFVCNNVVYQVKGSKVEKYLIDKVINKNISMVAFDRDDNLWIVTNDLTVYKKKDNRVTAIKTPFVEAERKQGLNVLRILGKEAPEPYFVTNFGTLWVNNDSLSFFVHRYPQFGKTRVGQATYVLEENDSTLWVGGTVGLSKLSGAATVRFNGDNGFCDNSVSCIFIDKEKNTWIGCTYNGVYKLSNEALFHLKPKNESVDLRHISDILPLTSQSTLVSTWGKGLYMYRGDSVIRITLPPYVRYITNLFSTGNSTYIGWFGSGLLKMDNNTLATSFVRNFLRDQAVAGIHRIGNQLLVSTLSKVCYITDENFNVKASVTIPESFWLVVVKEKIYRVSPFGEVDLLDNNSLRVSKKNIFPEVTSRITEMVAYRDNFLVGTFGQGLYLYDQWGKLVKKLDKKNGLNTNIVTSLLVDGSHLFIGSNLGLIRADLPDLESVKVFNENEGMFNWECRQGGLKKLGDGGIMIATTNGPYIYYPNKDLSNQYTAGSLSVARISYGDNAEEEVFLPEAAANIQLPHPINYKDNNINIVLQGISQRNPHDIIYHYQLQGYDSMWISTASPVIKLNQLPPGDYRLRAYISIGNYTSKQITAKFSVDTPLTGKLWFQALLVLLLSFFCWLFLTIGNSIYQKYIQTKMVSKLEADAELKQKLTAQSISVGRINYKELSDTLQLGTKHKQMEHLTPLFLKDISNRIGLLWKKDTITLDEFHSYFDELLADYEPGAKIYHKFLADGTEISMQASFHLLQIFSLYLFIGLHRNHSPVFSLDSGNKSNGHLLLRFYQLNHAGPDNRIGTYDFLKDAIERQKPQGVTIDVIENLEYGNMIIAELNLQKN